jgi:Meiotically up-regulated gene 113
VGTTVGVVIPPDERSFILAEIRRCADENGGKPLGRDRFFSATGITASAVDKHWVRWNDALIDAGLEPNTFQARVPDEVILDQLARLVSDLGHFPVKNELRHRSQVDGSFPNDKTLLTRFGGKAALVANLLDYVSVRPEWSDVAEICRAVAVPLDVHVTGGDATTGSLVTGSVYLMKSGKFHKIGRTNHTGHRAYQIGLLLPEPVTLVHEIKTDDPSGIESYWHRRFDDRKARGEWFRLTKDDIAAFRRRRFM